MIYDSDCYSLALEEYTLSEENLSHNQLLEKKRVGLTYSQKLILKQVNEKEGGSGYLK